MSKVQCKVLQRVALLLIYFTLFSNHARWSEVVLCVCSKVELGRGKGQENNAKGENKTDTKC